MQVMYVKAGERVILNGPASPHQYVYWYFNDKSQQIAWLNHLGGRSANKGEQKLFHH